MGERHFSEGASPPTGWIGWTLKAWELVKYSGKQCLRSENPCNILTLEVEFQLGNGRTERQADRVLKDF